MESPGTNRYAYFAEERGWTVFDIAEQRPVVLAAKSQTGLTKVDAMATANGLNNLARADSEENREFAIRRLAQRMPVVVLPPELATASISLRR
jgi:hypothetical protein